SRRPVTGVARWSCQMGAQTGATTQVVLPTGDQVHLPLRITLPADLAPGHYQIKANFTCDTAETQEDSFAFQVVSSSPPPRLAGKVALFDPPGQTTQWLRALGIAYQSISATSDLSSFDVLLIGKEALTVDGPTPPLSRVRDGLKVVVFEQTAEALE